MSDHRESVESPSPSADGAGGAHLSREQLLEYVKRQRGRIKALEAELSGSRAEEDLQATLSTLHDQRVADAAKIEALETTVARLQQQLAEELMTASGTDRRSSSDLRFPIRRCAATWC